MEVPRMLCQHEGLTVTTVTRIATQAGPFSVTVCAFQMPRPHRGPKVMTVTRMVTLGGPIPVTFGTFETRRKHEERKVTTITRIATSRSPIAVTAGTFERFGLGKGGPYHGEGCGIPRTGNIYPLPPPHKLSRLPLKLYTKCALRFRELGLAFTV